MTLLDITMLYTLLLTILYLCKLLRPRSHLNYINVLNLGISVCVCCSTVYILYIVMAVGQVERFSEKWRSILQ